ncbi:MAG TPA: tetratricopeptide repeat protein [bacterium]|jgi:tetratricopeptide (TPR) repeat protein|nr:tetratricopeptide repeat protein [bacterium]
MPRFLRLTLAAVLLASAPAFADESAAVQAYGQGVDQMQLGKWSSAESSFRKAVELKPDYAEAYDKLGLSLFNQNEEMEAVTDFKIAVAIDPRLTSAWYDLGQGFERLDHDTRLKDDDKTRQRLRKTEVDDAIAAYRKALEVQPGNDVDAEANAHFRLGVLLRDEAMRAWALAHAELPGATSTDRPSLEQANLKEAMLNLEAANALDPDFPENRNELGRLYDIIGRYPEAIEQYDRAIAERPGYAAAYSNRGVAWWKSGNWDRALADTLKATEIDPGFAGGHYNFAEVLFAHVQVLHLIDSDASSDSSLQHLEAQKAIAEYKWATDIDPGLMPAWYGLARAYRGYFDFADAEKTYDKIMDMDKRQRQAKMEMRDMLKQEAGFVSHIPRDYRPTPTPNLTPGS